MRTNYQKLLCSRQLRLTAVPISRASKLIQRLLHTTTPRRTDGVFRALTEARVQTPWIEALRQRQKEERDPSTRSEPAGTPSNRGLTPKRMSDSYHSVVLPLAQDPWLLDTYLNSSGHIRLGTIFMDLDALSGVIAYKHTGGSVTTVTAACDRITINRPLTEICDLLLSGQVTYATGRSSMEISIQVSKAPKEGKAVKDDDVLLTCTFTMVSLDPQTKKSVNINPVIVETEEEKRLFAIGERNSRDRKELSKTSLIKHTPNDLESDLIHAIWLKQRQFHDPNDSLQRPDNVQTMSSTQISTTSIMQPQNRNRHQFMIFGGFLLKQTFEVAFCCAAAFAHTRPTFVSLDPSTFENPVPVGSVLYLTATVTYTDPPLVSAPDDDEAGGIGKQTGTNTNTNANNPFTRVQVRVDSKVRSVEHGDVKPTGTFNYSFTVDKNIRVMPSTYNEFMMYIDARRRAKKVQTSMLEAAGDGKGQTTQESKESFFE